MKIIEILEDAYTVNQTHEVYWNSLNAAEKTQWQQRRTALEARARRVYARLVSVMPAEESAGIKGIPVNVPLHGEAAWAAADYVNRDISVDLGTFWDLPDDCLAYVLGHEIGHFVYESKNKNYWRKKASAAQSRQYELDADTYGALLAYRLGYDSRKAFIHFTRAYQNEPFDPKYPGYPSVGQRKAGVNTAIQNYKTQQAQPPATTTAPATTAAPEQPANTAPADMPSSPAGKEDLAHAMRGIQNMNAALTQDPQLAMSMFPGAQSTALA